MEDRFGVLPNFFRLGPDTPEITANLWSFAKFSYLDNPLPPLFKERLFVYLSRFCEVRYCIARHVGFLVGLGRPSGDPLTTPENIEQVVQLIRVPLPRGEGLEPHLARLESCAGPLSPFPAPRTELEETLLVCATHVFLQTPRADRCLKALSRVLDPQNYQYLLLFLSFVRTAHFWTKVHPELKHEQDVTELLAVHGALAECILNDPEALTCETTQVMLNELTFLRREREQAELLRTTLASIGDAVLTTDSEGRITLLNPVAEELTGWKSTEALGLPLAEVFRTISEETREPIKNPALMVLEQGEVGELPEDTLLVGKDGTEHPIAESVAPILDDEGQTIGVVLVFRDVAEQRAAENELWESEERYRSLTKAITSIVWTSDNTGRFVTPQESFSAYTGQSWEELRDFGWLNAIHPEDREQVLKNWEETRDSQSTYFSKGRLWHAPSQAYRHFEARGVPILNPNGTVREWIGKFLDLESRWQAEERLRYQLDLTQSITDNATTAIFMMDEQGRCTFMNPAAEEMTGFSFAEADGRILHELIHHTRPDGSPYPLEESPFSRALPEGFEIHNHEDTFIRKSGESFPVLCNARPIHAGGEPAGTVIEALDLTQQNLIVSKLRESEARFIQLGDAIPQLVWMAQPDGHIDWYSNRWYEYTGTTFEEMEGWGWEKVQDPEVLPEVVERWKHSLATGEPLEMVFPLRSASGEFRPFLTRALPFRNENGQIVRWFGTNTDISEQKRIQEELREIAARLSEADRRKDEFLATLAHELRNPLAPIRTGLEVMKLMKDDPVAMEEVRETMERQTKQLITLVDDLLDVSRITSGKLELRKCRVLLSDVLQSAVEASRPFVDEAHHTLMLDVPSEPIQLEADPHRLAQVLSNLLNNAAKYTPDGGSIALRASRNDQSLSISVQDNGIGIPEDKLESIFEMFTQIDQPMEQGYTGLGIGLTLVKSLTEMHGGRIEVQSDGAGEGSTFTVSLPLGDAPPATVSDAHQPGQLDTRSKRRVLVVDDNQAAANMLSLIVKMLGNEVRTAGDGAEAISVAAEFMPDILLMDIGMPKMNGYEAARHIRQQDWGKQMVLVALTGWGQEEDRFRTQEAGFDYHLVKPAEPAELEVLLAKAFENR